MWRHLHFAWRFCVRLWSRFYYFHTFQHLICSALSCPDSWSQTHHLHLRNAWFDIFLLFFPLRRTPRRLRRSVSESRPESRWRNWSESLSNCSSAWMRSTGHAATKRKWNKLISRSCRPSSASRRKSNRPANSSRSELSRLPLAQREGGGSKPDYLHVMIHVDHFILIVYCIAAHGDGTKCSFSELQHWFWGKSLWQKFSQGSRLNCTEIGFKL